MKPSETSGGKRYIVYLDETWFDTHEVLTKGWVDKQRTAKAELLKVIKNSNNNI
jgi:hypothetical protein